MKYTRLFMLIERRVMGALALLFGKRIDWQEPVPLVGYLFLGKIYHPKDWRGGNAERPPPEHQSAVDTCGNG